jgi:hypothetical protein
MFILLSGEDSERVVLVTEDISMIAEPERLKPLRNLAIGYQRQFRRHVTFP